MAPPLWIGWSKNKNAGLLLHPLLQLHFGRVWLVTILSTVSTLLTHLDTLILQLRLSVRCASLMAPAWFIVQLVACNHNQKLFGDKLTSMECLAWLSLTRWTARALTFSKFTIKCAHVLRLTQFLFRFQLVLKRAFVA